MNKKLVLIVSLVSLVMVAAALTWVILGSAKDASQINNQQSNTDIETALKEAESFRPEGMCTTVMTPARHQASGATYTFNSGCIPEGWERVEAGDMGSESRSRDSDETNSASSEGPTNRSDRSSSPNEQSSQSGNGISSSSEGTSSSPGQRPELSDKEKALHEAESFRPEGMCTTVMTPARHQATGVTYTFTSGCIPAGWEKI